MELIPLLVEYADWLVASSAILGALWLLMRKAKAKTAAFVHKANAITETMLGREEIRHPDTGKVLVEATPGLGFRLAHMEEAIVGLSNTQNALAHVTVRLDDLTTVVSEHIAEAKACLSDSGPAVVVNQTLPNPPTS